MTSCGLGPWNWELGFHCFCRQSEHLGGLAAGLLFNHHRREPLLPAIALTLLLLRSLPLITLTYNHHFGLALPCDEPVKASRLADSPCKAHRPRSSGNIDKSKR